MTIILLIWLMLSRFNAIKVRLILSHCSITFQYEYCFNAIKVRLIFVIPIDDSGMFLFQCHKGTINIRARIGKDCRGYVSMP
jgi:hypothetical protein